MNFPNFPVLGISRASNAPHIYRLRRAYKPFRLRCRTPTLIMGGRHDHFLTPEHHLPIASLVPGAKSRTFENSGHSAYFEESQEFNRVVAAFLDSHGR
ncbi:MAG: alpha/beta fold hydrolase [Betaproteobacteria bacterium]|nr:alpha/beta fold hydrolase [Betaproteobacteria bacterium]